MDLMTTVVLDPRPELIAEEAVAGGPVLADTALRVWQTVGNSYESLTTGAAPGNGARTVPAPHDHGVSGPGVFVAQAASRWQGSSELEGATVGPFGLPYVFVWAACVTAYAKQEMSVVIFGTRGRDADSPRSAYDSGRLLLEIDGLSTPFEMVQSQDPNAWSIFAGLGIVLQGVHTLSLRLTPDVSESNRWTVDGAEVWSASGNQMEPPP